MTYEPKISVRGVGSVSWPPDTTVISFAITARSREYSQAVQELNERVAELRGRLEGAGVDPKRLKTTQFGVDAEYRTVEKKQVFWGWGARHGLRLELPVDRDLLNKALEAVATGSTDAEFAVGFEVKDRAGLREAVLADATKAARRNADAIVSSAGCRLGKVLSIEYHWSEIRFGSFEHHLSRGIMAEACGAPDIEPEDVDAEDSVTLVWELIEGGTK
jgi:uncharacterized protein YggE